MSCEYKQTLPIPTITDGHNTEKGICSGMNSESESLNAGSTRKEQSTQYGICNIRNPNKIPWAISTTKPKISYLAIPIDDVMQLAITKGCFTL